jgi:hypothetical protein
MDFAKQLQQAEWITLQYGIMWVFHNVAGADGVVDKAEQQSLKILTSKAEYFPSPLVREILKSIESNPGYIFRQSMQDNRGYKRGLSDVANIASKILNKEDLAIFKKTMIAIGFYIANISGVKGESKVSDEEVNILASLAYHLKMEMQELQKRPTISEIIAPL